MRSKPAVQEKPGGTGRAGASPDAVHGPDLLHAAAAGLALLVLYAMTACRTIHTGDSPELATAAAVFGVPHPPGYPLYTLVSGLLVHLMPLANKALAANLTSALYGAIAAAGAWLLFRRSGAGRAGSWFGALALGLGHTFWLESTRAEVYSFDLLLFVAAVHAALSASSSPGRGRLFVAGLAAGLWVGHRFVNAVYLVPLLVLSRPAPLRMPRREGIVTVVAGFAASFLVYAYLPLASAADPVLDIGDPETWGRFWTVVTAGQYARHLQSNTPELALLRLGHYAVRLPWEVGLAALAAAAGAAVALRGRDRRAAWGWLLLIALNLGIASRYNILDIDDYYLPSYLAIAALGAAAVGWIAHRPAARRAPGGPVFATAIAALLGALALPLNLPANDLRRQEEARSLAEDILASAAPNGVVLTHGDTTIHSLWYLQGVEKRAPDVVVVSLGHSRPWHYEQLRARHPSDPWPEFPAGIAQQAMTQRAIEALSPGRRVFFTMTTDVGELAADGARSAWLRRHDIVPHGLLYEIRAKGSFDPGPWALWTVDFWKDAGARLRPADPNADSESHSIAVERALALTKSAELLLRSGRSGEARTLFSEVVRLDPDPVESDLLRAYRRIGWQPPLLQLGRRARAAIAAIDSPRR